MSNENNINTHLTGDTTPTFTQMLATCGLSPEQWLALDDARKQEWLNVWFARNAEAAQ